MVWHGYPSAYETFLEMTLAERVLDNEALDELIDVSNRKPDDDRR
jgi:hypothetical protein